MEPVTFPGCCSTGTHHQSLRGDHTPCHSRTSRNQTSHDHVFLVAVQVIHLAVYWNEGAEMGNERVRRKARLGDSKQNRVARQDAHRV